MRDIHESGRAAHAKTCASVFSEHSLVPGYTSGAVSIDNLKFVLG